MRRLGFAWFTAGALATALAVSAADFRMDAGGVGGELARPSFRFSHVVHGAGWRQCGRVSGGSLSEAEPPPADGRIAFTSTVSNGVALAGEMSLKVVDRALAARFHTVVTVSGHVETVSVQGSVRRDDFAGGRLVAGGTPRAIPAAEARFDTGLGTLSSLRLESADGGRFLDFDFARPVVASVLGKPGRTDVVLRFSAVRHADLAVGDEQDISFTLKTHEPIEDVNTPWTVAPGPDFVPLTYRAEIVKGSALDFSGLVPRVPCGTHGRLRAKGGHFEFDGLPGVRQKFFGMNLHSHACYHTLEEARRLTDLFVRCGYNAVRFHNYENEYQGLTKGSPDEATPVPERFAGLDNLVAACRERGLYVTLDLHVGRRTSYRAIGVDKPGMVVNSEGMKGEMKYQYLVNPKARANFKAFVRGFFEHVNPHTGRRYADEPTLALVSVVNESPCCWGRYGPDGWKSDLCREEHELMREMRAFIRDEVKSDVPLTTCNGGAMPFCLQPMREAFCDYVDDHFYYDHPAWPAGAKWTRGDLVPLFTANRRQIAEGREIPAQALLTRLWGRPYVITEFNWCAPSLYRASAGLLVGALGGAQDWDGLWRYLWAHDHARCLEPGSHRIAKLESASDALALAADRAALCLFLRGDMAPLARKASVVMDAAARDVKKPHRRVWSGEFSWPWAGWHAQLGTAFEKGPAGSIHDFHFPEDLELPRAEVEKRLGLVSSRPAEGAVALDRAANAFTVTTPRTCGGSVEKGAFTAGPLTADCGSQVTTLWASALEGASLVASPRILITHLTRLYNAGDRFADRGGRYLLENGESPYLMPRAKAMVRLRHDGAERLKVYALDTDGSRRVEVPVRVENGSLAFTCDTARDPRQATFLYEVVEMPTDEVRLFDGAEACPSADGARVLFQRDTPAGRRVGVRTQADGRETWIDDRPGHATSAGWGADGAVVYTWGHEPKTAHAAQKDATGFNLWVWKDGARRQLTFGRERDYTPCVSPDGRTVFFATTRGEHGGVFKNTVALWTVPTAGGEPTFLAEVGGESCGMVSPRVSPDGRILVWAQVDRFFDTWHLQAARVDRPGASCTLTPRTFAAYSPAWHPRGDYLAFCGFRAGDPGWGVYLMHVASGAARRVADGRNPAFSSDGGTLYYDRGGAVYSRALAAEDFPPAVDAAVERARAAELEAETIHVRAKVVFQPAEGLSFVMRGVSKVHPLTLQLFFRDPGTIEFATRRAGDLSYAHVVRHAKFVPGRAYVLTGIRRGNELQLSIDDGVPSVGTFAEGLMPLVEPEKIEKGANFKGEIKELRVARGWPAEVPRAISRETLFR